MTDVIRNISAERSAAEVTAPPRPPAIQEGRIDLMKPFICVGSTNDTAIVVATVAPATVDAA